MLLFLKISDYKFSLKITEKNKLKIFKNINLNQVLNTNFKFK